jgi:muramoyltetrapeptide carboxypeptidase
VEELNWTAFQQNPKWIIGFSDVTVFHQKINQLGVESIHGIMPLGFTEGSMEAKETLHKALFGETIIMEASPVKENCMGTAKGSLIGGNMTIIYSLIGTELSYTFKNKILFIEDIGEHIYKVDRMLHAFKLAGIFNQISGLILGGFTEMEDTDVPFGKTIEELILEQVVDLGIPVAFNVPIGHIPDNQAVVVGRTVTLTVNQTKSTLLI